MIIGNGLIANAFKNSTINNHDIIIFASGVSNSNEIREKEYSREEKLLNNACSLRKFIIYFSTCSVYDPTINDSPYVIHKLKMESLVIKNNINGYFIFRLPQVVGNTNNTNTLVSYLNNSIKTEKKIIVWKFAKRRLIDIVDIEKITSAMYKDFKNLKLRENIINIAPPNSYDILHIIKELELINKKKASYDIICQGSDYEINVETCMRFANNIKINFDKNYLKIILNKYFCSND